MLCCVLALIVFFQTRSDTAAGEKHITISVVHSDSKSTFSYDTDAEYLGEVLTEEGLAEGTEYTACSSPPLTAKPQTTAKNSGGASQKTAKMVNTGADQTPIQDQDQFELTLKEGY